MNTPLIVKKGRGTNLVYKGYTHRKDGTSGGKQYWRCTQRTACKGRVHTTGEGDNVTVVMYKDHDTHMPDEEKAVKVTVTIQRPYGPKYRTLDWFASTTVTATSGSKYAR